MPAVHRGSFWGFEGFVGTRCCGQQCRTVGQGCGLAGWIKSLEIGFFCCWTMDDGIYECLGNSRVESTVWGDTRTIWTCTVVGCGYKHPEIRQRLRKYFLLLLCSVKNMRSHHGTPCRTLTTHWGFLTALPASADFQVTLLHQPRHS